MNHPLRFYGARVLALLPALLAFLILGIAIAQLARAEGAKPAVVTGEILQFGGGTLKLKGMANDQLTLAVPEGMRVTALTKIDFSELKKDDYVAVSAVEQADGTLRAIGVRIFPEQLRGVAEGHHSYPGGPDNRMTNATIAAIIGDVKGRTFKVTYKGGEKTVMVPEDAPVMRMGPGSLDMLKPGAHVSIFAEQKDDGAIEAKRISVGTGGLVPPI
jgi:hypothetical protein